jgi:hypothetical protein
MKSVFKALTKISFVLVVLAALVFSGAARASGGDQAAAGGRGQVKGEAHGHDRAEDEAHGHEQAEGEAAGVKLDHHGLPVYDEEERVYQRHIAQGVSLEFTIENFLGVGGRGGDLAPRIIEGEHAVLQFHVTDAASGAPRAGLRPAVWLDPREGDISEEACRARV